MRKFFGIETGYTFEVNDIVAVVTIFNVLFIIMGFWWAPILGLANCGIGIVMNIINRTHINLYIMQIAFVVLNIYFLM